MDPTTPSALRLHACESCSRRVRDGDALCPFCGKNPREHSVVAVRGTSALRVVAAAVLVSASAAIPSGHNQVVVVRAAFVIP